MGCLANVWLGYRVEEIAKKRGISMAQVSIAWSLTKVTAPVVGSTKLENLKDIIGESTVGASASQVVADRYYLAGAIHVKLTDDEIKYLEEPYRPTEVFGHW